MEPTARRTRPLPVQVGSVYLLLVAEDVNVLVDGIGKLVAGMANAHADRPGGADSLQAHVADLEALRMALVRDGGSLADPPFEIARERLGLLRQVMSDITGYQRGELTPGLRELRTEITDAS